MNELKIFSNPQFGEIRTVDVGGEVLFVAADVCKALEISNPSDAMKRLDEDEKARLNLGLSGGETNAVTESGLYSLVLGSRKQEAKQFKRWITHEVLPSIRKHGAYMTPETLEAAILNPDTMIRVLTALKDEQSKNAALKAQAAIDAPKVLFAAAVEASHTSILVGDLAKIIQQNGVDIGQKRLFAWLREKGYLIKQEGTSNNMPTQRSMDMGLFRVKETAVTHSDGHISISRTVKVTGRGQTYFVEKFLTAAAR